MNRNYLKGKRTKEDLRQFLNMKKGSYKRHMKALEPELLEKFPNYNKYSTILFPKIFEFIIIDYWGEESREELNEKAAELFGYK